jgi:pimeloyl-ACP methyl ester carboxylesterase
VPADRAHLLCAAGSSWHARLGTGRHRRVGVPEVKGYLGVFFAASPTSRAAGQEAAARMLAGTAERDAVTSLQTRLAQYDAVCAWGIPDHAKLQRVSSIEAPVFVANGDSDPMILPHYSYLLAGLIPHARLEIYPDSAHGFLFQHHQQFAADIEEFLSAPS